MHQLDISENTTPELVVVDNFYKNPEQVRELALSLEFDPNPQYHKGSRTHEAFAPEEIQRKFETLMGKQIYNWNHEAYPNGVFQYCTAEDKIVYHMDTQTYAAVVYLTPDAPPECGTSFFRSKINKIKKDPNDENLLMEIF